MIKIIDKINLNVWILTLLSALLLSVPFILPHFGLIALIGFIPLFAAEHIASTNGFKRFFIIYYIGFVVWNIITTYWVWFATPPGALAAIILNSLQMAIIFALFRWLKRITKGFLPYIFFMFTWLAWEHAYFTWDISWPWLVLGNSFATSIKSIQWYEYTGTLGGSMWILLSNILLFRLLLLVASKERFMVSLGAFCFVIAIPLTASGIIYNSYKELDKPANFTVLQPNIDPYTDKFYGMSQTEQTNILLDLINESNDIDGERLVLAPETFIGFESPIIVEGREKSNINFSPFMEIISNSRMDLIIGAVTQKIYNSRLDPTPTARFAGNNMWYDIFNTAIFLDKDINTQFYHKSKLVILAEKNPFAKGPLKFIDKLVSGIEGGIGNYGTQDTRSVFKAANGANIGVAICYESIYGDFYRDYVLAGANVMGVITNDGWWKDTPGHKQHLSYASLRAIETRRSIARSANTGISAFINQRGEIVDKTKWWERGYLNGTLNLNEKITIFVKYGDIIGRVSGFIFFLFMLLGISRKISNKTIPKESC